MDVKTGEISVERIITAGIGKRSVEIDGAALSVVRADDRIRQCHPIAVVVNPAADFRGIFRNRAVQHRHRSAVVVNSATKGVTTDSRN